MKKKIPQHERKVEFTAGKYECVYAPEVEGSWVFERYIDFWWIPEEVHVRLFSGWSDRVIVRRYYRKDEPKPFLYKLLFWVKPLKKKTEFWIRDSRFDKDWFNDIPIQLQGPIRLILAACEAAIKRDEKLIEQENVNRVNGKFCREVVS